MIKKLLPLTILFLIIPIVMSANYGEGKYGCGLYGVGCEEAVVEEEEPAGSLGLSAGARGGGCDVFADYYKVCFHINQSGECEINCEEGYYCDEEDYRCKLGKLVTKTITETILEKTGGKKAVIISLFLLSIILLGFIFEVKKLKKEKSTEKIIKEASSSIYEKEEK